ncbi:thymidylate kinase [Nakamurella panacisegetis]|uniref:Thymidylate kinase n=1 Tax=Nakamurella panacisegetis TaxID=1090615 RepID=A0A1H0NC09_9ACTN|nr:MFS transporter [Nakamurella panacisegetis]SDO90252.1 thymidylate kinase [Nakamurella panacisegetis]
MSRAKEPSSVRVLLRIVVFRRLWAAIAISSLGDWLGLLATTALAAYLTKNSSGLVQGAAVSGVLLTRLLPDLVLGPFAGALVDKIDRRMIAVIGDTTAGLLYLSIAVSGNLTWLLTAQFLVEAVGLFTNPAKQAMLVNIVPRERLAVANQLNYVSIYGMVPIAAAVFALLSTIAQFFGAQAASGTAGSSALISGPTSSLAINIALCLDALTYFFVAGTVLFSRNLIPSFVGEREVGKSIFSLITEGIAFVRNSRVMRAIYIGILGAFGAGGLTAGVAQAYVSSLGAGNAGYGILFGSVFTGLAIGMLIGPKVLPTLPRRMVFTSAIGAAGLVLIVMSLLQDFVGASIAASVMGLFAGIAWINGFTMIGHEVSDALRGRVFGFVMSSVRLTLLATIAAGPVVAGAVGSHLVLIGAFRWRFSGAAIVLASGGLIAILVSVYAARQVGRVGGGFLRRLVGHRRPEDLIDGSEHPGVLLAVEGADAGQVARYITAVGARLRTDGYVVEPRSVSAPAAAFDVDAEELVLFVHEAGDGQAAALRAGADLAELVTERIRPDLDAGKVVLTSGYVDDLVVRFGVQSALGEEPVLRLAQWAVGGLRPDLTVLVDAAVPPVDADPVVEAIVADELGRPAETSTEGAETGTEPETGAEMGPEPGAESGVDGVEPGPDPVAAFRDRASAAPERYLVVAPLPDGSDGHLTPEVAERIASVLRGRSPARVTAASDAATGRAIAEAAPPHR